MTVEGVLAALADPTRRQVLDILATPGEATATALAAQLPVTRQAVLKHRKVLESADLVTHERSGREVRYAVQSQQLAATAQWLAGLADEWNRRLARIKRLAEGT